MNQTIPLFLGGLPYDSCLHLHAWVDYIYEQCRDVRSVLFQMELSCSELTSMSKAQLQDVRGRFKLIGELVGGLIWA